MYTTSYVYVVVSTSIEQIKDSNLQDRIKRESLVLFTYKTLNKRGRGIRFSIFNYIIFKNEITALSTRTRQLLVLLIICMQGMLIETVLLSLWQFLTMSCLAWLQCLTISHWFAYSVTEKIEASYIISFVENRIFTISHCYNLSNNLKNANFSCDPCMHSHRGPIYSYLV